MKTVLLSLITSLIIILAACRKDSFITSPNAQITVTVDTLKYDTVFTTTGSIVQSFKIVNNNNRKLRISSIKLMGGATSAYKINVDGVAATEVSNEDIAANDSIYVFVQVNVNPATGNLPFVIRDSIRIMFNGNTDFVQLEAWGQNAHFFRNREILSNETWPNDLPYVILGYLHVAANTTLNIQSGCRIYMHANAPILVDGTILANGNKDSIDRIWFRGDRLDDPYRNYPASWPGIYFSAISKDNVFNYALFLNSYQALALTGPSVDANPKLQLNQCIIDNSYDVGILSENSSVTAVNCLISNCGKNLSLAAGGVYRFTHCTVASWANSYINHTEPVLNLSNTDDNNLGYGLDAIFRNCIFWGENGTVDNEVVVSKTGSNPFTVNFDHVLWKVATPPANATITQATTQPPQFDTIDVINHIFNFHLGANSPAIDAAVAAGVFSDLDGNPRPVGLPDIGCYERQ